MANILGVQMLGVLFGSFMVYYNFLQYKRKEFTIKEYGFWFIFWSAFVVLTIFPQILDPLLATFGIIRALDLFVITGFLFLTFVIFYTYVQVRRTQKKLEDLVRNIALKKK